MANLSEIRKVIERGESHTVEFKKKTVNLEKMVKELISFANSSGGNLYIGVADNGELSGLKNPEEDIFLLKNAIKKYVVPYFQYTTEIIPINRIKSLVCISIPESKKKPHYLPCNRQTWRL